MKQDGNTRHHLWAGRTFITHYRHVVLTLIPRGFRGTPSSDEVFVLFWGARAIFKEAHACCEHIYEASKGRIAPDSRHLNKNKHIRQVCSCNSSDDCSRSISNGRDGREDYSSKSGRGENNLESWPCRCLQHIQMPCDVERTANKEWLLQMYRH